MYMNYGDDLSENIDIASKHFENRGEKYFKERNVNDALKYFSLAWEGYFLLENHKKMNNVNLRMSEMGATDEEIKKLHDELLDTAHVDFYKNDPRVEERQMIDDLFFGVKF